MGIDYKNLPVYEQKQKILDMLKKNQVVVVQSPTGSGKTTQLPVILHEADYSRDGIIAVTQPRRIAALSVSEFISRQLGCETYPGLVGYKMRFEDKTDASTKIKIMTDGILLQEMKLDPMMTKYSVIMVDEAHERSLNIDFVLGLLKRCLRVRKDLKVIVSSATMNAESFSEYFDGCPIVTIETSTFPVALFYDAPIVPASTATEDAREALLMKIEEIVCKTAAQKDSGSILIFLPGERAIHDCVLRLAQCRAARRLFVMPLYGRLPKEEQEKVFVDAPANRIKVIVSTNIAETSLTIDGVTTVIDSGLAKLNYYSPQTFTSSLVETPVSKASCLQRRGRAGRTMPGTCYRLYSMKDFERRDEYTLEEIFRTDLSEVVLRMAELGIRDFENFDFISKPSIEGIRGAMETLFMLKALNEDRTLSSIGQMMALFPLLPRISRIIVEAILKYPNVLEEAIIAAAFLSTHSPFILPPGREMEARKAHHRFNDIQGDFVGYIKLYRIFEALGGTGAVGVGIGIGKNAGSGASGAKEKQNFAEKNYLDYRVLVEIQNIVFQLSEIVSAQGIPINKNSFDIDEYLCCVAAGMIQFVCVREGRENFRTLTADHITIHPGSSLFRTDPLYIVAGEIVQTSRMFAMSVSPLTKRLLAKIDPTLEGRLEAVRLAKRDGRRGARSEDEWRQRGRHRARYGDEGDFSGEGRRGRFYARFEGRGRGGRWEERGGAGADYSSGKRIEKGRTENRDDEITIGGYAFQITKVKGKKTAELPWREFQNAVREEELESIERRVGGIRSRILMDGGYKAMDGERLHLAARVAKLFGLRPVDEKEFDRSLKINLSIDGMASVLSKNLKWVLRLAPAKAKSREMGFVCLFTDRNGNYWFKISRGFSTALSESLASLEFLADEESGFSDDEREAAGELYRKLNSFYR